MVRRCALRVPASSCEIVERLTPEASASSCCVSSLASRATRRPGSPAAGAIVSVTVLVPPGSALRDSGRARSLLAPAAITILPGQPKRNICASIGSH